jgi:hypothetical protein
VNGEEGVAADSLPLYFLKKCLFVFFLLGIDQNNKCGPACCDYNV